MYLPHGRQGRLSGGWMSVFVHSECAHLCMRVYLNVCVRVCAHCMFYMCDHYSSNFVVLKTRKKFHIFLTLTIRPLALRSFPVLLPFVRSLSRRRLCWGRCRPSRCPRTASSTWPTRRPSRSSASFITSRPTTRTATSRWVILGHRGGQVSGRAGLLPGSWGKERS